MNLIQKSLFYFFKYIDSHLQQIKYYNLHPNGRPLSKKNILSFVCCIYVSRFYVNFAFFQKKILEGINITAVLSTRSDIFFLY